MSQLKMPLEDQAQEKKGRKFFIPISIWFVLALLLNFFIIFIAGCLASNTRSTGVIPVGMVAESSADYSVSSGIVFAPLDPSIIDEFQQDNNALLLTPDDTTNTSGAVPFGGTITMTPTPTNTPIPTFTPTAVPIINTPLSTTSTPSPTISAEKTVTVTVTITSLPTIALTPTSTNTPIVLPTATHTSVPSEPTSPSPPTQPPPPPTQPPPTQPPPPTPTEPPPTEPPQPTPTQGFQITPIPTEKP